MRERFCVAALLAFCACGPAVKDPSDGLMSIDVTPENQTLTYMGSPITVDYQAIGHYDDGHTEVLPDATFALDTDGQRLGNIDVAQFKATGQAGGKGAVLAQAGTVVGGTSVIVVIHPVHLGPGVPTTGAGNFPDSPPMGATSPTTLYPLDGAVMPASVKSPDVQWEGANGAGDLYRVRISAGQFATVDTILAAGTGFNLDNQVSDADWRMLVNSAGTGPITFDVAYWNQATSAAGAASRIVHMVPADITGAIYYWNLGQGQMEKIDSTGRKPAIPNPPARASATPAGTQGSRCVACHTVSRDGRYLAGSLWGGGLEGGVFDMSNPAVQTSDPAPTLAPVVEGSSYKQLFATFNQDATRLMINDGLSLRVINPATGQTVATTGTPLPATNAAHPAWSPDGSTIAFVNNISLGGAAAPWAVDYDRGDLAIIPVTGPDAFGAASNLVAASSVGANYLAPSWPTFSPDSQWIIYSAGNNSRGMSGTTPYVGSLFLVNKNGGATVRLDTLCGGMARCYLPNFSPYDAGGYYWVVFYSVRDYGNALAGTKGTTRRQMWIAAIDKSKLAQGGVDASAVAYWVPDQDVSTNNMSAFWSLPTPIQ